MGGEGGMGEEGGVREDENYSQENLNPEHKERKNCWNMQLSTTPSNTVLALQQE